MDTGEILRRFEQYLDTALAEEGPPRASLPRFCKTCRSRSIPMDWYTMWAAVTALTQEVGLQGRAR